MGNPASFKCPSVLEVNACSVRKVSSVEQSSGSSEARSKIPAIILKALGLRLLFIERKRSSQRGLQYDAGVEGGGREKGRTGWAEGGCSYMRGWATRNFTQFQPNADPENRRLLQLFAKSRSQI